MNRSSEVAPLALGLVSVLLLGASVVQAEKHDRVRRTRSFEHGFELPRGSVRLVVDNLFGEIRVSAGDSGRIVARIRETIRARDEARADAAEREVSVVPSQRGGEIDLFVDGPFRDEDDRSTWRQHEDPGYTVRYDFEIEVPPSTDLDLRTVTDGDVDVAGVGGGFRLGNVNGSVRLIGADGAGSINTVNGGIEVVFVAAPSGDSDFETVNGSIEIGVPEGTGAQLRLKSTYGDLSSDFPFELVPTAEVIEDTTEGGRKRFRVGGFSVARIGGGGPTLEMETLNGDVRIVRAR